MPIGWNGLSMPTEDALCACPLSLLILSLGIEQNSVPNMMNVIFAHIPVEYGVVDLMYIDSLMVLVKPWSFLPMMVKLSELEWGPD